MDDDAIQQLLLLDPKLAADALIRVLGDHPAERAELLRSIREKAPGIYAEWLVKTAGH